MEREDHINKLRNKLNSQTVISDKGALWNELEPRLPKQKKNRKIIFWLPLAVLLFFATFLAVNYLSKEATPQPTQTSVAKIDNLNKDITSERNSIENRKQERNNSAPTTNTPSASKTLTESTLKKKTENLNVEKNNTLEYSTNVSSKTNKANNPTTYLYNSNKIFNNKDLLQNPNNNKSTSRITGYEKFSKTVIELINEKSNTQKHSNQNKAIDKASRKPFLFPTLQKLGIEKINSSIKEIDMPNYVIQNNIEVENEHKWLAAFSTYALAELNFKSQKNLTPYGTEINNLTTIMSGYSIGGRISIKRTNGLFFGLGMEQIRTYEKFKIENAISSMERVINEEAFLFKGQFIANEQEVLITTKQSVLSYNTYTKTSLVPFVGYTINKNLDYEFAVAPILNLKQNYAGYLIDENRLITSDLNHLFQCNGVALSGYSISASVAKQFKNKVNLGLHMKFRNVDKNVSESNTDFGIGLKSLGIGLKLRVCF